eukprot:jgi/Chlat1/636/Chrsp103S00005
MAAVGGEQVVLQQKDGSAAPVLAYYVTGHGLGHATRVVEVCRHLIAAGCTVHVVTGAPENVFTREIQSERLHIRKAVLDCGAVQQDALTVDRRKSLSKYVETAVLPRAESLATEEAWLKSINAQVVVSDIVPMVCTAATNIGIPAVCVTNFSWDFIYAEYVSTEGHQHRSIVFQIAEDYSRATLLLRLPGFCPMPAFRDIIDMPLVVRHARRTREEVRAALGVALNQKLLLLHFGGQDSDWVLQEKFLPPGWVCMVCVVGAIGKLPPNFMRPAADEYMVDLVAASDAILGKIGYGTTSEALAHSTPLVYVRRDFFNEEPFLRKLLETHNCAVEMSRRDFFAGNWHPYLDRALKLKPMYSEPVDGGQVVAKTLIDVALGRLQAPQGGGKKRLRDAIVLGFLLQRTDELNVPDWYARRKSFEVDSASTALDSSAAAQSELEHQAGGLHGAFQVVDGSTLGLADTEDFLQTLSRIGDDPAELSNSATSEERAACGLFRFEEDIIVTRAPGRLDVMGGIADYSGSLVLQMPIKEACHVALQRQAGRQRLWKHTEARLAQSGKLDNTQVLRIVSLNSEAGFRAATFDMDLADLYTEADGQQVPISYEAAREFFHKDKSRSWAAYIAGAVLVLMREKGTRFDDGMSILVHSLVPEGKGVSSSAAVEVASMAAIAAAHHVQLEPRELAILCQKVENLVVGAPCGVMDQMASACGQANRLLALLCQPAEIQGLISVPPHMRFWGLDSGLKHSVGGADYGSVRIGAFMGRKIVTLAAEQRAATSATASDAVSARIASSDVEANMKHLVQVPPHRLELSYAPAIPDHILGSNFISKYGSHEDTVTTINPSTHYAVRTPMAHPINENFRVKTFAQLLKAPECDLSVLGELMYQSHASYSLCGLGSPGTDLLVALVEDMQQRKPNALFGAKITGGGSGGTVCALGGVGPESDAAIQEIQQAYCSATGHTPYIFEGSSPGACQFGHLIVRRVSRDKTTT